MSHEEISNIAPTASEGSSNVEGEVIEQSIDSLMYLGRASVRIETLSDEIIYINPYSDAPEGYEKEASLVLVTHQHNDHNQVHLVTLK